MADSHAVIARTVNELQRLATSDNEVYATYYGLVEGELRLPDGGKWDRLRGVFEQAMFPWYKQEIRFAALSLDGIGLSNYGECSFELADAMIAHRATGFFENGGLFMERMGIRVSETDNLPKGYRSTWDDRSKLCVQKVVDKLDSDTKPSDYAGLVLAQGATSDLDEFVEVHIWGPITARTMHRVTLHRGVSRSERVVFKSVSSRLRKIGVEVREWKP